MYPAVRPGDLLHVESRTVDGVAVGDVAVCRRRHYLFGHRVIDRGETAGRRYVVTRPDRGRHDDDGPTYDEDLLGIVVAVERGRRRRAPTIPSTGWPAHLYWACRLGFLEGVFSCRTGLAGLAARVQRAGAYRRLVTLWRAAWPGEVSYVVRLPSGDFVDVYHPVRMDEFDLSQPTWRGRLPTRWTLALHLAGSREPAAQATYALRSSTSFALGWCVETVQVRGRYRGLGFEEAVLAKGGEILARAETRADVWL